MECPAGADASANMSSFSDAAEIAPLHAPAIQNQLGCVWTGASSTGCTCQSNIPEEAVTAAWRRELEQTGERADRFFRFAWEDGVWLAYGLKDGGVRGVHCPPHRAEREERAFVADSRVDERADEFALYA